MGIISLSLCLYILLPDCWCTDILKAEYVIVLTGRELRGRLMGHAIYRSVEFEVLPLNPNISVQHPPHPVEAHLLALVRSHLQSGFFLFSYTWDLTRRLQTQWKTQEQDKCMWKVVCMLFVEAIAVHLRGFKVDERFFWNRPVASRSFQRTPMLSKA
jgi:hypothetical protein